MTFEQIKEKLKDKTVGIAGAGGLGSNCAVALARVGVGKIIIADFDVITHENLNRQYFFIDQVGQKKVFALTDSMYFINMDVKFIPVDIKLTPSSIVSTFKDCDVLVEAFDLAEMKQMIIETAQTEWPDKPLVTGLGMAGWGNSESIHLRKVDNLYICGDEESEIGPDNPPLAPRVGMVANMQANVVLDLLLKN